MIWNWRPDGRNDVDRMDMKWIKWIGRSDGMWMLLCFLFLWEWWTDLHGGSTFTVAALEEQVWTVLVTYWIYGPSKLSNRKSRGQNRYWLLRWRVRAAHGQRQGRLICGGRSYPVSRGRASGLVGTLQKVAIWELVWRAYETWSSWDLQKLTYVSWSGKHMSCG